MIFRTITGLLILMVIGSCIYQPQKDEEQVKDDLNQQQGVKTGLKIEYGPNLGMIDEFTAGNYIHITATITNDSTIPINLQMALSKEYDFPDSCGDNKYKIFLLPKEFTPDTATLYGIIADGLGDFLNKCLENPYTLNKTLEPNEYIVITIGVLFSGSTKCSALPRAVFTQSDGHNFQACDSQMNLDKSTNPQLALGVKLDFYSGKGSTPVTCILYPFGQISYPKN
ncbi:hypothetical protein OAF63_03825 [Saprospiraceae bacterium]|jgi:hypothetical protein|nr:hypothetical protein [Saprospiraceae bacterium]